MLDTFRTTFVYVAIVVVLGTVFVLAPDSRAQETSDALPLSELMAAPGPEAVEKATLYFFHSPTCPHCREEQVFLDRMQDKYPELEIHRYEAADTTYQPLMVQLARDHGAEQYLGLVPLTFVNGQYFTGYDSHTTTGVEIERAIRELLKLPPMEEHSEPVREGIHVPIVGTVYPEDYSLGALAITLGFLDGFNVCSLGALILIIGLSLKLQRRRAIVLFGGLFILTTALVYGGLIVAWYKIFDLFTQYITLMKVGVAFLALGGGLYFLKEYLRMRKVGAVCELTQSPFINKLMERTGNAFEDNGKLLTILGAVFLFAAVVTVVEFPCSAAVPVVFAGILAEAGLSTAGYLGYIGLFVLFYMLDELIIFSIAAYRLKLWMMNGTFTKYAVLAEALILTAIGAWYLGAATGIF